MDISPGYADLSLLTEKTIDPTYFLTKIKTNGFSHFALDHHISDPKIVPMPMYPQQKPPPPGLTIPGVQILRRITLIIENSASLHPLNQQQCPYQCDVLAIRPGNEKMFHAVCTEYDSYDVIAFQLGTKLPFMLKRNPVYEAIRKGKYFQIYYEPLFDDTKRTIAMTNIINIIKATGGKNLIVSSQASQAGTHRTPYDIAAMLISLGLDKGKALATMKENCMEVIRNGQHRKFLKGAIQEIPATVGVKLNKKIRKHRERLGKIRAEMKKDKEMQQEKPEKSQ